MPRTPLIAFAAILLSAQAALAQTAPQPAPPSEPQPVPQVQPAPAAQPDMVVTGDDSAKAEAERLNRRNCLRETGSRIVASANARVGKDSKDTKCAPAFGRVYSREDIESTGHQNIADALRTLDPTIH